MCVWCIYQTRLNFGSVIKATNIIRPSVMFIVSLRHISVCSYAVICVMYACVCKRACVCIIIDCRGEFDWLPYKFHVSLSCSLTINQREGSPPLLYIQVQLYMLCMLVCVVCLCLQLSQLAKVHAYNNNSNWWPAVTNAHSFFDRSALSYHSHMFTYNYAHQVNIKSALLINSWTWRSLIKNFYGCLAYLTPFQLIGDTINILLLKYM